jgi:diphthamide synthase
LFYYFRVEDPEDHLLRLIIEISISWFSLCGLLCPRLYERTAGHSAQLSEPGERYSLQSGYDLCLPFVASPVGIFVLSEFSPEIDPCGENGEFHTFVYAGPMFQNDLSVEVGEINMLIRMSIER